MIGNIGGLKSIAELLGWEYNKVRVRESKRVTSYMVMRVSMKELLEFLEVEEVNQ